MSRSIAEGYLTRLKELVEEAYVDEDVTTDQCVDILIEAAADILAHVDLLRKADVE